MRLVCSRNTADRSFVNLWIICIGENKANISKSMANTLIKKQNKIKDGRSMGSIELFLVAVGLSMDAFAVAVCKGLAMKKLNWKNAVIIALYFGVFQALMPLIGYFLGVGFQEQITEIDHWIAFILLSIIGLNMIRESLGQDEEDDNNDSVRFKDMIVLAIATSIDALAVGITLAFLQTDILPSVTTIGITTFVISLFGVKIGNVFGEKYKSKAEFVGGLILVLLGVKILLEHLGVF